MMGQKVFQEKFFYDFNLSKRIPDDHILRRLSDVVNLSFVRRLTAPFYSHTGQPSIDPVVLFKMMLLGYLYGITSERRLAEECGLNLAFMWYLGYDLDETTPDHSVISKARSRYGKETFEKFFEHVLGLCVKAGLVTGEKLFADSTLIRANASLDSVVPRSDAFRPNRSAKEHVEQVFSENPVVRDDPEPACAKIAKGIQAEAETSQAPLDVSPGGSSEQDRETVCPAAPARRGRPAKPRRDYNWQHVSRTDPDASVITRPVIGTGLFYRQHFTVDSSRVITAVQVTSGAQEAIAWAMRYVGTAEAKTILKERSVIAEGTVGEDKVLHGLRRANCRVLDKVTIQALFTTAVQNMKRLARRQLNGLETGVASISIRLYRVAFFRRCRQFGNSPKCYSNLTWGLSV